MTKIMVRTYVVVRHSGQNWYWGILKRRLLGVQLARPQTSGQREEKSVALLDYGNTFQSLRKKMAYNVAIKSSKTAIRECLHRSKAIYACVGANRLKMAVFIRKSCVLRIDTSLPLYIPYQRTKQTLHQVF